MRWKVIRHTFLAAIAGTMLASCASGLPSLEQVGPTIDRIPTWLGGEPEGVPPRQGTPEYEALQAKRAQDQAVKSNNDPAR